MDKKAVKEALETIENAKDDEEFRAWLEEHQETLDFEYDNYKNNVYENPEEPLDFETWALGHFLSEGKN